MSVSELRRLAPGAPGKLLVRLSRFLRCNPSADARLFVADQLRAAAADIGGRVAVECRALADAVAAPVTVRLTPM